MLELTDIEVFEGDNEEIELRFVTPAGAPYDLTGGPVQFTMKANRETTEMMVDSAITVVDGPGGVGSILLPGSALAKPGAFPYRVRQTTGSGTRTIGAGRVLVRDF